jgi:hypothetical protein
VHGKTSAIRRDSIVATVGLEPFDKWSRWAPKFLGSINHPYNHNYYILVCIDYVTKWMEAKALPTMKKQEVVGFIHEESFTIFRYLER